jgi:glycosyltransferase involved in cell wall biosynthesis
VSAVLFVLNSADDSAGGTLRAAINTAEAVAGTGVGVTIAAPHGGGQRHDTIGAVDPRVQVRLFPAHRLTARAGGSWRMAWWLARSVRSFDEVHVHSVFHLGVPSVALICAIAKVPYVVWPHGCLDSFDLRKHARVKDVLGPVVLRPVLARARTVICTSGRERDALVTWGARPRVRVVPLPVPPLDTTGVDRDAWRRRHGLPTGVPLVLFLGRVNYKKGLPLLVEALARLERDWRLVVVGSGEPDELAALVQACARHGVTDQVVLTGWLDGAERLGAFAAADAFVLLSENENFGLAVAEAASAGCPVIVSEDVHIAEELAAAGAAVAVRRDAASAARAIDALLSDPAAAARMAVRGQEFVRQTYSPTAVGTALASDLAAR